MFREFLPSSSMQNSDLVPRVNNTSHWRTFFIIIVFLLLAFPTFVVCFFFLGVDCASSKSENANFIRFSSFAKHSLQNYFLDKCTAASFQSSIQKSFLFNKNINSPNVSLATTDVKLANFAFFQSNLDVSFAGFVGTDEQMGYRRSKSFKTLYFHSNYSNKVDQSDSTANGPDYIIFDEQYDEKKTTKQHLPLSMKVFTETKANNFECQVFEVDDNTGHVIGSDSPCRSEKFYHQIVGRALNQQSVNGVTEVDWIGRHNYRELFIFSPLFDFLGSKYIGVSVIGYFMNDLFKFLDDIDLKGNEKIYFIHQGRSTVIIPYNKYGVHSRECCHDHSSECDNEYGKGCVQSNLLKKYVDQAGENIQGQIPRQELNDNLRLPTNEINSTETHPSDAIIDSIEAHFTKYSIMLNNRLSNELNLKMNIMGKKYRVTSSPFFFNNHSMILVIALPLLSIDCSIVSLSSLFIFFFAILIEVSAFYLLFLVIHSRRSTQREFTRLEELVSMAESKCQTKSSFLASMSHELRTPMAAILGLLDLILSEDLIPEVETNAQQIKTAASSLLGLLNSILDLSKVEAGKLVLDSMDFNLRTDLEAIVEMFSVSALAKGIEVTLDLPAYKDFSVRGDPARVRQIFNNLLSNSIKFTSSGYISIRGWIVDRSSYPSSSSTSSTSFPPSHASSSLFPLSSSFTSSLPHAHSISEEKKTLLPSLSTEGELMNSNEKMEFVFELDDSGIGIPIEKRKMVFETFTQADQSHQHAGTGLGLSIVRSLVELMGGSIKVIDKPTPGTLFRFNLVLDKCISPPPQPSSSSSMEAWRLDPPLMNALWRGQILLAFPDSPVRSLIKKWLSLQGLNGKACEKWEDFVVSIENSAPKTLPEKGFDTDRKVCSSYPSSPLSSRSSASQASLFPSDHPYSLPPHPDSPRTPLLLSDSSDSKRPSKSSSKPLRTFSGKDSHIMRSPSLLRKEKPESGQADQTNSRLPQSSSKKDHDFTTFLGDTYSFDMREDTPPIPSRSTSNLGPNIGASRSLWRQSTISGMGDVERMKRESLTTSSFLQDKQKLEEKAKVSISSQRLARTGPSRLRNSTAKNDTGKGKIQEKVGDNDTKNSEAKKNDVDENRANVIAGNWNKDFFCLHGSSDALDIGVMASAVSRGSSAGEVFHQQSNVQVQLDISDDAVQTPTRVEDADRPPNLDLVIIDTSFIPLSSPDPEPNLSTKQNNLGSLKRLLIGLERCIEGVGSLGKKAAPIVIWIMSSATPPEVRNMITRFGYTSFVSKPLHPSKMEQILSLAMDIRYGSRGSHGGSLSLQKSSSASISPVDDDSHVSSPARVNSFGSEPICGSEPEVSDSTSRSSSYLGQFHNFTIKEDEATSARDDSNESLSNVDTPSDSIRYQETEVGFNPSSNSEVVSVSVTSPGTPPLKRITHPVSPIDPDSLPPKSSSKLMSLMLTPSEPVRPLQPLLRAGSLPTRKHSFGLASALEGVHVLLAEDVAVLQRVATLMLKKLGATVVVVGNGKEALDAVIKGIEVGIGGSPPRKALPALGGSAEFAVGLGAERTNGSSQVRMFDVVLMDCQMPIMDGYESTRLIRQYEKGTGLHTPIIALTANAMSGDKSKCIECGMDAYLTKPIDSKLLADTVRGLVAKGRGLKVTAST